MTYNLFCFVWFFNKNFSFFLAIFASIRLLSLMPVVVVFAANFSLPRRTLRQLLNCVCLRTSVYLSTRSAVKESSR